MFRTGQDRVAGGDDMNQRSQCFLYSSPSEMHHRPASSCQDGSCQREPPPRWRWSWEAPRGRVRSTNGWTCFRLAISRRRTFVLTIRILEKEIAWKNVSQNFNRLWDKGKKKAKGRSVGDACSSMAHRIKSHQLNKMEKYLHRAEPNSKTHSPKSWWQQENNVIQSPPRLLVRNHQHRHQRESPF